MSKIRRDGDLTYIEFQRYVFPDFTIKYKKPSYGDNYDYFCQHFCLEELIMVEEETSDNWEFKEWASCIYISLKIEDGRIYVLDRSKGWLPHAEATQKYIEILAERELLGSN